MNHGTLTMNGGTIKSDSHGIYCRGDSAKGTISNITMTLNQTARDCVATTEGGQMNIYNSKLTTVSSGSAGHNYNTDYMDLVMYNCTTTGILHGMVLTINTSSTGYTVKIYGYPTAKSVRFGTWTSKNGQDDLKWTTTTKTNSNNQTIWQGTVNISDHNNEKGLYYTHVYVTDSAGKEKLSGNANVNL